MEKLIIQNMGNDLGDFLLIELVKNGVSCVIMVDGHTIKNGYTKSAKRYSWYYFLRFLIYYNNLHIPIEYHSYLGQSVLNMVCEEIQM